MSDLLELNKVLSVWHENNKAQLKLLADGTEPVFVIKGKGDKKIEVKGEILKGLRLGALLAIETIGDLPYTIQIDEEE